MARQEINLGALGTGAGGDTTRSAGVKINAMTQELYQGHALASNSGWGGSPVVMPNTASADTLPQISALFLFGNGGQNLPYPYVFITQETAGGNGYIRQTARSLLDINTWERQFLAGQGGGAKWQAVAVSGSSLPLQRDLRQGLGMYTPFTYVTNLDDTSAGMLIGPGYCNNSTTGTYPPGESYGVVNTLRNAGDHVQQDFVGLTGASGVTRPLWRRSGYGDAGAASFGPWRMVYDDSTALRGVGPGSASGLMDVTVYNNNCVVHRYLNGAMEAFVTESRTIDLVANGVQSMNVPLPVVFLDPRFSSVSTSFAPSMNYDLFGTTVAYLDGSGANVLLIFRNGLTPQAFTQIRVSVRGRWK
jgi:hypothetical protein